MVQEEWEGKTMSLSCVLNLFGDSTYFRTLTTFINANKFSFVSRHN